MDRWDKILLGFGVMTAIAAIIGFTTLALQGITIRENEPPKIVQVKPEPLPPAVHFPAQGQAPTLGNSACLSTGKQCAHTLLAMMNTARAAVGSPPLHLDWVDTHHQADCISAGDHAKHLVQAVQSLSDFGVVAHDQFGQACALRAGAAAQNVGEAPGSKYTALQSDFQQMMAEGHSPLGSCLDGHDCAIDQRAYHEVSLAFAFSPTLSAWFIVEDFHS